MKRRERLLVGMMVVAVGYGFFHYMTNVSDTISSEETAVCAQKRATKFVDVSQARIMDSSLSSDEVYAEDQIVAPWLINPFAERMPVQAAKAIEIYPVNYSGYMDISGRMFGLINGRAYQIGDVLPESPYRILSIDPSQVVLSTTNCNETIIVKLMDEQKGGSNEQKK